MEINNAADIDCPPIESNVGEISAFRRPSTPLVRSIASFQRVVWGCGCVYITQRLSAEARQSRRWHRTAGNPAAHKSPSPPLVSGRRQDQDRWSPRNPSYFSRLRASRMACNSFFCPRVDRRVSEVEFLHCYNNGRDDKEPGKPFVVSWHHVPRRVF